MGMEDFWEQLPTGKEDKPLLFEMGPLEYDFHDIDGLYFMLDRRLSGCLLMMWAKPKMCIRDRPCTCQTDKKKNC